MAILNIHINFNGNAEEAFNFYKSVFGGEFSKMIRFKDIVGPEFQVPEGELEKLMNISLPIGNNVLIGNDVPEFMGKTNENENRSKISVAAESRKEAYALFKGLSEGGNIEIPMSDSAEGESYAMFRDKYGIEWIIEFNPQQ